MSIINTSIQTNNLASFNQPSQLIQNSNVASNLYLGPGGTNVPGMTNVYFAPTNFIDGIKALIAAVKIGDKEGIVENTLRVIEAPFCLSNAFMQCIYNALHAGVYFNVLTHPALPFALSTTGPLSLIVTIAGFIFCTIEGAIESFGLIRTIDFYKNNYPSDIEALKEALATNDPQTRQLKISSCLQKISELSLPADVIAEIHSFVEKVDLSESELIDMAKQISEKVETNVYLSQLTKLHQTYFQILPDEMNDISDYVQNKLSHLSIEEQNERKSEIIQNTLDAKKCELTRKVHPWLANEIESSLPDVIRGLQAPLRSKQIEAKDKAESIFANLKIQSQKKMLIHSIGIFAVLVTIAGLIAGCISCPIFIPFLLLLAGGGLAISRGVAHFGYMDTKGWDFSTQNCIKGLIPEFIRNLFSEAPDENKYKSKITYGLKYTIPGSRVMSYKQEYKESLRRLNFTMAKA